MSPYKLVRSAILILLFIFLAQFACAKGLILECQVRGTLATIRLQRLETVPETDLPLSSVIVVVNDEKGVLTIDIQGPPEFELIATSARIVNNEVSKAHWDSNAFAIVATRKEAETEFANSVLIDRRTGSILVSKRIHTDGLLNQSDYRGGCKKSQRSRNVF